MKIVRGVEAQWMRADPLRHIAEAQLEASNNDEARGILITAREAARNIKDESRALALDRIAKTQV